MFSALIIVVFWYVTPCTFIDFYSHLPNYTVSHPKDRNFDNYRPRHPKFHILLHPCLFYGEATAAHSGITNTTLIRFSEMKWLINP